MSRVSFEVRKRFWNWKMVMVTSTVNMLNAFELCTLKW